MRNHLNCGIYEVDLKGTTDASFKGKHPALIIRKLYEPTVYYVIPLTTYTKEKWEKSRKFGCCRILSTNSIARIDKLQVRENVDIPKRYIQNGKHIIPTHDEVLKVIDKINKHVLLSTDKAIKEYQKFYEEYVLFDSDWKTFLTNNNVEGTNFAIKNAEPLILTYPLNLIKNIYSEDIINILKNNNFYFKIAYNKNEGVLQINLSQKP